MANSRVSPKGRIRRAWIFTCARCDRDAVFSEPNIRMVNEKASYPTAAEAAKDAVIAGWSKRKGSWTCPFCKAT